VGGVFISYRRGDCQGSAGRLYDDLGEQLGDTVVFRDIDAIQPGVDYWEEIIRTIDECDALLAVIGSGWLESKDRAGNRRLDSPEDLVLLEIASALEGGKVVIPVLIEEADMPAADDLPERLRPLAARNALPISDLRWNYDVGRLVSRLQQVLQGLEPAKGTPAKGAPVGTAPPASGLPVRVGAGRGGGLSRGDGPNGPNGPVRAPGGHRRAIVLGVVGTAFAVSVIAAALVSGAERDDPASSATSVAAEAAVVEGGGDIGRTLAVAGAPTWTDTGIDLEAGDEITVAASGTFYDDVVNQPTRSYGPDGVEDLAGEHVYDQYDFNHAALMGRIGEGGSPFFVGADARIVATETGRLFFGIHDFPASDNGGEYGVVLRVIRH